MLELGVFMKFSKCLIPTVKNNPQKTKMRGHKLLIKSGFIRMNNKGIYTYLYMAWKIIKNISEIISTNMNYINAQEILLPILQSSKIWITSKRWKMYGKELFKLGDRHLKEYCLAPTHEELITLFVKENIFSYKKFPLYLYQIQTKFRDEIRPQAGLIRSREFIMKDAYSFDINKKNALVTYKKFMIIYKKIFNLWNIQYRLVLADAGNIGGSKTHEFRILTDSNDESFASCKNCKKSYDFDTYEKCIVSKKNKFLSQDHAKYLCYQKQYVNNKSNNLLFTFYKIEDKFTLFISEKSCNLDLQKIYDTCKNEKGHVFNSTKMLTFLLRRNNTSLYNEIFYKKRFFESIYFDHDLLYQDNLLFNDAFRVYSHISPIRNLYENSNIYMSNLTKINNNSVCFSCNNNIKLEYGIEIAHIFFLGSKYTNIFDVSITDSRGSKNPLEMGCYGIGVSRLLSAIIEEYSDTHGIIWPLNLAPFKVSLVLLKYNKTIKIICDALYAKMLSIGISVIYDDRESGATEKLKDNYLIGVPLLVVIGSNFSKFKEIDLIKHRVLIKKIKISNINDISLGVTRYIKNLIV